MRATPVTEFPDAIASIKRLAARIGPTVCELDGPIPILKRSKVLIAKIYLPLLK
jgi:hypothetical protein